MQKGGFRLNTIYTIWKKNGSEEPFLLKGERFYHFKFFAFRRAKKLARKLTKGWENAILVRKITRGKSTITQWTITLAD